MKRIKIINKQTLISFILLDYSWKTYGGVISAKTTVGPPVCCCLFICTLEAVFIHLHIFLILIDYC